VNEDVLQRARGVRLAIFDVDGVMTDGTLWIGARGEAMKAFNIQDGNGLKLLQKAGIATAILSGRKSAMVAKRAKELTIAHVIQGTGDDKVPALGAREEAEARGKRLLVHGRRHPGSRGDEALWPGRRSVERGGSGEIFGALRDEGARRPRRGP